MLPSERKARILAILRDKREASVAGLAQILEVPAASIRRDLRELEGQNRLYRRHGKAIYRPSLVTPTIDAESDLDEAHLDELVEQTAFVLSEARNLFLTGGPVLVRIASKLRGKTIATHDLQVAMAAAAAGNDVTIVGREIDNQTMTVRAGDFAAEVAPFWFDAAVLESDALDDRNVWVQRRNFGFLPELLERSDSLVAVARSTTLGRKGDRVACPLERVDLLVIDRGANDEARTTLSAAGVELRVGGDGGELPFGFDQVGNVYLFKRGQSPFDADGAEG